MVNTTSGSIEPELLRVEQAAEVLGISRARFYQLLQRDEVPCVRIGRSTRVPVRALRQWIDQRTSGAAAGESLLPLAK